VTQQRKLLFLALAAAFAAPPANAAVDLIAVGSLDGHVGDLATQTSAPLENGAAGNLFGGIGSGIAYAGCNTLVAVPDRGPNAIPYNTPLSDTASYINRFHTLSFELVSSAEGSALPFDMNLTLTATTLLRTAQPLFYGDDTLAGVAGAPALNITDHTHYFTGRSDNFDASQLSTDALDARFDPESIRLSNDGASVFISDEYGPYIYRFNRKTGQRTLVVPVPESFAISKLRANGDDEIAANAGGGRITNKGMEGLAISPDGNTLFGVMQSPLAQDGGTSGAYTRILKIDLITGDTAQYTYPLTNIGTVAKPKYPTVSDIVAINGHEFLLDERDGKGLGDNSTAAFKKIFSVDLDGQQDVSGLTGEAALAPAAIGKTPFLDIVTVLNAHGFDSRNIPAKLEGTAFGPDIVVDGDTKHTFIVANDNDFIGTVTDSNHPDGFDNPNRFFVFAVDPSDVPDYVPQQLADGICKRN
jgi:hypothetical protein